MMILINAIFIAIASYIYLQVGGVLGAFLFSIGLLTILNMNFKLYTGAIGFIHMTAADMKNIVTILFGNLIGVCLLLFFPHSAAIPLVATKLALPLGLVMIKAIVCLCILLSLVSAILLHYVLRVLSSLAVNTVSLTCAILQHLTLSVIKCFLSLQLRLSAIRQELF